VDLGKLRGELAQIDVVAFAGAEEAQARSLPGRRSEDGVREMLAMVRVEGPVVVGARHGFDPLVEMGAELDQALVDERAIDENPVIS
jgi:hypothetical protein